MSDDLPDLPMHLVVAAAQRMAANAGAGFYIRHRGEAGRGTLLVVLNDRAGGSRLYRQIWDGQRRALSEMDGGDETAAEAAIVREVAFDPDLWVVEIEDKQGRLFFDMVFSSGLY